MGSLVALLLVGSVGLVGCSDDVPPQTYSASPSAAPNPDVTRLLQRSLNQRAKAMIYDDLGLFHRTLDRSDAGFAEEQDIYYDNMTELPVKAMSYRVLGETLTPIEDSDDYWVEIVVAIQLRGFDAAPVRTRDRVRFTPSDDGRQMLISSMTDEHWELARPADVLPWDKLRIYVDESAGVLGIFDETTWPHAEAVIHEATLGRYDVREVVGYDNVADDTGVVIYALKDPAFLRSVADQSIGDPDRADGLTIGLPVDARRPGSSVASYRIFLNARVLNESDAVLGRLVRHELTHATLGSRGRGAPLWLTEGIAEYVSVRPIVPSRRQLPVRSLEIGASAADLPSESDFSGPDAEAWYGVSWWVCEYIASTFGEETLLGLLDQLDGGADQAQVLDSVLGLSGSELTQRGVALMRTTYN